jgi:site-specific DNA recombinase
VTRRWRDESPGARLGAPPADGPSRDDGATVPCPLCRRPFTPSGSAKYCSELCRKKAWRRRYQVPQVPQVVPPVSSESQEARGTIGSQLEALRARVAAEGHELVGEFCDDGWSGARIDRPGLDALRDQAEAGGFEAVWCLSPDRLARAYVYQVLVLDELERLGVRVVLANAPAIGDDPQLRLLTQVQGAFAEWERAVIAERNRRGRLFRSRAGEVVSWKAPYGYRRVPRDASGPARLEVFEPEADVVRRIYDDYVNGGRSIRQVMRALNAEQVPTPTGKAEWWHSTVCRVLSNEAYIGRVYINQPQSVPARPGTGRRRPAAQRKRPREEWTAIPCPAITDEALFEAAQKVSRDNSRWSPRHLQEEAWLLRGLVRCGTCGTSTECHKMTTAERAHHYYWCHNHASNGVPGQQRCPERNIRADALDGSVFEQVRAALLRPEVLSAGEGAFNAATPTSDDQLLAAELARLGRKLDANRAERRRLADLYQSGLLELGEVQRRARDIDARHRSLAGQRDELVSQRQQLAVDNRLQQRVSDFARRAAIGIDQLSFQQRQQLLRLIVDHVSVTGWQVEVPLRIPLDEDPGEPPRDSGRRPDYGHQRHRTRPRPGADEGPAGGVSSKDGLRSLRRVAVAHEGCEHRQEGLDVATATVAIEQLAHCKEVPEVVDPRPAAAGPGLEACDADELAEKRGHVAVNEPGAGTTEEEARRLRLWAGLVAP